MKVFTELGLLPINRLINPELHYLVSETHYC